MIAGSLATNSLGSSQSLSNVVPVDHIPYLVHVLWTHVLVLEVVSMFPYINSEQGDQTWMV